MTSFLPAVILLSTSFPTPSWSMTIGLTLNLGDNYVQ